MPVKHIPVRRSPFRFIGIGAVALWSIAATFFWYSPLLWLWFSGFLAALAGLAALACWPFWQPFLVVVIAENVMAVLFLALSGVLFRRHD